MKKRTSNLLGLIALAALAVGVVGLASGGFKDWSAFTKAKDNAASVIGGGSETSKEPSSGSSGYQPSYSSLPDYNGSTEIEVASGKRYFSPEENLYDTLSVTATVDEDMPITELGYSLSWNPDISHSSGDPADYVVLSNKQENGGSTSLDVDCIRPFTGEIGVIFTNAYGGSKIVGFHVDVSWSLWGLHPYGKYRGETNTSWMNGTYDGKSYGISVNEQGLYGVSERNWFILAFCFQPFGNSQSEFIPGLFEDDLGIKTVQEGARPRNINAAKANSFLDHMGIDSYFTAYGGRTIATNVYINLSIKTDFWSVGETIELDELPFEGEISNLIKASTPNMVFGDAGLEIRRIE